MRAVAKLKTFLICPSRSIDHKLVEEKSVQVGPCFVHSNIRIGAAQIRGQILLSILAQRSKHAAYEKILKVRINTVLLSG